MIVGFTGTHIGMTPAQKLTLRHIFEVWNPAVMKVNGFPIGTLRMGDCVGADAQAADIAWALGWSIIVHPPIIARNRYNWTPPAPARQDQTFVVLEAKEYMKRNRDIVDGSNRVIGTPAGNSEELRSGTWAAIRYTRKKRIPLSIVWPDGSILHERNPEQHQASL